MKDKRKFLFVGTRPHVIEKMLSLKLDTIYLVKKDSFAERLLIEKDINYSLFANKSDLIEKIKSLNYDVLVSNGCPYILPISEIKRDNELYINIHPGLLPEIRGASPVNASILFNKPQGVTCHIMDDGIDTGRVISRVFVTRKNNIPLDLLYKLSFLAEGESFEKAYKKDFKILKSSKAKSIYYTRKESDQLVTKKDNVDLIIRKVKAFQIENQYSFFIRKNNCYNILEIEKLNIVFLENKKYKNDEIVMIFNNNVLTKEKDCFLLWRLNNVNNLSVGEKLL